MHEPRGWAVVAFVTVITVCSLAMALIAHSLTVVAPLETQVVQSFGRYAGTVRQTGLVMTAPLTTRRRVNVRVNNFETRLLKVNDADGNPVELGAIVVWQVRDTARSVFAVQDYVNFVQVQAEAALRHVAVSHPYDDPTGSGTSLRGSTDVVADELAREMFARVTTAGVERPRKWAGSIRERRSGWMHRKAEEGGALVLGVDRRQRREAPPGRREPDQPICAASKSLLTYPRASEQVAGRVPGKAAGRRR